MYSKFAPCAVNVQFFYLIHQSGQGEGEKQLEDEMTSILFVDIIRCFG